MQSRAGGEIVSAIIFCVIAGLFYLLVLSPKLEETSSKNKIESLTCEKVCAPHPVKYKDGKKCGCDVTTEIRGM